jgi:hypothetical protein
VPVPGNSNIGILYPILYDLTDILQQVLVCWECAQNGTVDNKYLGVFRQ